jgi:hypothetical protein
LIANAIGRQKNTLFRANLFNGTNNISNHQGIL